MTTYCRVMRVKIIWY